VSHATLEAWHAVVTPAPQSWEALRERVGGQPQAPPVALWIMRHGETTMNAARMMSGSTDVPLTELGRRQAHDAGVAAAGTAFDIAFASQLSRSRDTLAIMTAAGGLQVPVAEDARLAERSLGTDELQPRAARDPRHVADLAHAPDGGESYLALTRRCLSFLLDVRELAAQLDRPLAALVNSHQGPLRMLTAILDETADPASARGRRIENCVAVRRTLQQIAWPSFTGVPAPNEGVSRLP
jgi:probable phosphoglycerate mutase